MGLCSFNVPHSTPSRLYTLLTNTMKLLVFRSQFITTSILVCIRTVCGAGNLMVSLICKDIWVNNDYIIISHYLSSLMMF